MGTFNSKDKPEIVILLTSCVNPNKMDKTLLLDSEIRLNQYLETIRIFLQTTELKIVIVDNTNLDYSKYMTSDRLECLQFAGNDYDKSLGKGFGEAKILEYAFTSSQYLKSADYIIKITGRTYLRNFNYLLAYASAHPDAVFVEIPFKKRHAKVYSRAIFAPKSFYKDYFLKDTDRINDSTGYFFESHLYCSINEWLHHGRKCIATRIPFKFHGISGTNGKTLSVSLYYCIKTFIGAIILNNNMKSHKSIHKNKA